MSPADGPSSIADLDLSPRPDTIYYDPVREWREDFIYFLMVDRFHDGADRTPSRNDTSRSPGVGTEAQLSTYLGGTLKGIEKHLDYIQGLGCTALWLSPVFENVEKAENYHGYAIENYLRIQPDFGTKEDLVELVKAAHARDMRVILDVVLNHTGDVYAYDRDDKPNYDNGRTFPFGRFRKADRPIPRELQKPEMFHRRGRIQKIDAVPETELGDLGKLKDLAHGTDDTGNRLMEILTAAHCYWIREADVDGFRLDAVKHLGALATARFSSNVREYAYRLGKRSFFTFGELASDDDAIDRFIGPNTVAGSVDRRVFFGVESVLDFPLYNVLGDVIKAFGKSSAPKNLFDRYDRQRQRALNDGELGRYLVTFLDNHDNTAQAAKQRSRFAADAPDEQVIAGVAFLLCALGTACIYYGTEQGLSGKGPADVFLRQPLFDPDHADKNFLNTKCGIYVAIARLAKLARTVPALKFGRMAFREISKGGVNFGLPQGHPCTLAFSRLLADQEVVVAYNTSTTESKNDAVVVGTESPGTRTEFTIIYDSTNNSVGKKLAVQAASSRRFVRVPLGPMQFVVLG